MGRNGGRLCSQRPSQGNATDPVQQGLLCHGHWAWMRAALALLPRLAPGLDIGHWTSDTMLAQWPCSSSKLDGATAARKSSALFQLLSMTGNRHRILRRHIWVPKPRGWDQECLVCIPPIEIAESCLLPTLTRWESLLTTSLIGKNGTLVLF